MRPRGPRKEFFYFTDSGDLNALRYNDWKIEFAWVKGNLFGTGHDQSMNVPIVVNLREDPFERFPDESMMYTRWWGDKLWGRWVPASRNRPGSFLHTFVEFPPSQKSGSFSVQQFLDNIQSERLGRRQITK